MFFRNEKEVFIISYAIAVHEPGYPSYCLPLNVAHVDKEGTLRATCWKGNDAMKEHPVPVKFVAMDLQPVLHQRLDHLPVTQGTGQRRQDQPQPMRPDKFI
jgi:hypothetical protein